MIGPSQFTPGLQQAFTSAKPTKNIIQEGGDDKGRNSERMLQQVPNLVHFFSLCLGGVQLYLGDLKQYFH